MLYRYFSILFACALVIAGLQVPGVILQYEQRLQAHLYEVKHNLTGFQQIADEYHGGSLSALIEKHRASTDTTFSSEAQVIEEMYTRYLEFELALSELDTSFLGRIQHVALHANHEVLTETLNHYSYIINLNLDALVSAGVFLIVGIVLCDVLRLLVMRAFRRRPRKAASAS